MKRATTIAIGIPIVIRVVRSRICETVSSLAIFVFLMVVKHECEYHGQRSPDRELFSLLAAAVHR
jgi:hypothetical protein